MRQHDIINAPRITAFRFATSSLCLIESCEKKDKRIARLTDFFAYPDREHTWQDWIRQIGEELLVTDATAILPTMTRAGDPYKFELLDGSTLRIVVDEAGRTPTPPEVAYQQVLHGVPALDLSADQVVYWPRNRRVWKVWGMSPVEQIIMTVNIALRRQTHQLRKRSPCTVLLSVHEEVRWTLWQGWT